MKRKYSCMQSGAKIDDAATSFGNNNHEVSLAAIQQHESNVSVAQNASSSLSPIMTNPLLKMASAGAQQQQQHLFQPHFNNQQARKRVRKSFSYASGGCSGSYELFSPYVLASILSFLSHKELIVTISSVSKYWYEVSRNSFLWHTMQNYECFSTKLDRGNLASLTNLLRELFVENSLREYEHFTDASSASALRALTGHSLVASDAEALFSSEGALDNAVSTTTTTPLPHFVKYCPVRNLHLPKQVANLDETHKLKALLELCPVLTEMHLPQRDSVQCQSLTDHGLYLLSTMCAQLHTVNLSTHDQISNEGINYMALNLHNQLRNLVLDHCYRVNCDALIDLLSRCTRLKSLSALFCRSCIFNEEKLMRLTPHMKHLESISIEVHTEHSGDLSSLGRYAKNLTTLHLRGWDSMESYALSNLLSQMRNLQNLTISCSGNPSIGHVTLRHANLKHFSISRCKLLHMVHFDCPQLETFFAESIQTIHGISFEAPQLSTIKMRSTNLEKVNWSKMVQNCSALEEFDLLDCLGVTDIALSSESLKTVSVLWCNDLEKLHIKSPSVEALNVDGCMQLQQAHIVAPSLTRCEMFQSVHQNYPELKHLTLVAHRLGSLSLLRCINLQTVNLKSESLTDLDLSGCKRLETLSVQCPKVSRMAVSAPKVSGEQILKLPLECPRVELLNILNMKHLKDNCFESMCTKWPTLTALSISGCSALEKPSLVLSLLKGLHVSNCKRLQSLEIHSKQLQRCIFKTCPQLTHESIQNLASNSLLMLEVAQCNTVTSLTLKSALLQSLVVKSCNSLKKIAVGCARLSNLMVSGCEQFTALRPLGVSPTCAQAVFQECPRLGDSLGSDLSKLAPNLRKLTLWNCAVERPTFTSKSLQQVIVNRCRTLREVKFESNVKDLMCRLEGCPQLQVTNFSQLFPFQEKGIRFLQIVDCGISDFEMCHSAVKVYQREPVSPVAHIESTESPNGTMPRQGLYFVGEHLIEGLRKDAMQD
eukprot:CAMPEP_0117441990 /NCGR_PEP_ID=MMETSP0759-20121206/3918_1 /TAXON_ID=63605 /ORGANISM="Percolomonas cosmopolitus, Strain WS" /LENGTH=992 /DNA_ID=CAMNT_0005233859 /DNA_START=521 /DNA_END=3498 /DNA_ORIENTATION=+